MIQKVYVRLKEIGYQPIARYKVESFIIDYYEIWLNHDTNHTINLEVSKKKDVQIYSEVNDLYELK